MVLFFLLNFFGIRLMSEANRWVTWWKLIIPSVTAVFMFTILRGSNFTSLNFAGHGGFAPYGTGAIFEALSTSGVVFAYLGFRQALDYAGEARNPQRHLPLATVSSVAIAVVIYVAVQIAFIGAVNWGAAGVRTGDWAALRHSRHVARGMWLVVCLLAVYLPSYYGGFGPEKSPPLPFPWGTLVAVGIGLVAFGWGVLSGFNTEEFQEIVRAAEAARPSAAAPRGGTGAA